MGGAAASRRHSISFATPGTAAVEIAAAVRRALLSLDKTEANSASYLETELEERKVRRRTLEV